jgi:hypothetical protein
MLTFDPNRMASAGGTRRDGDTGPCGRIGRYVTLRRGVCRLEEDVIVHLIAKTFGVSLVGTLPQIQAMGECRRPSSLGSGACPSSSHAPPTWMIPLTPPGHLFDS